jgi:FkbM family methyltransferase
MRRYFTWAWYMARYLTWIVRHPLNRSSPFTAIGRYLGWQFGSRLLGHPVVYPFVNDLRMQIETSMWGATGVVYFGLEEYRDMAFCAHFLRPGDVFVDVGACFGTYTILASGVGGADSIAFEPNPVNAERLNDNARLNRLDSHVKVRALAVGARRGTVLLTNSFDGANHVVTPDDISSRIEVPLTTLDSELAHTNPVMIKIDVEGYEQEVLDGGINVLSRESLVAVIMEDVGLATRYRTSVGQHKFMLDFGFRSFRYCPEQRQLIDLDGEPNRLDINTLYLRNVPFVRERVLSATPFRIRDRII